MRILSAHHRRFRGNALVEFALGFLVFVALTVGLVELGRAVWTYTTVAHAARQGARFAMARGSLNPASADDVAAAVRAAAIGLDKSRLEVATRWESGVERGGFVQVTVRYPMELVAGKIVLPAAQIRLGARARVVVAN
jgi:Flp pilus assembly protein TadG